jgi:hypothetical protein
VIATIALNNSSVRKATWMGYNNSLILREYNPGQPDPLQFGNSVAVSRNGKTMIVGAPEYSVSTTVTVGAAFIFDKTGTSWNIKNTAVLSTQSMGGREGGSVAISDDGRTCAVGDAARSVVQVYEKVGLIWTFVATLSQNAGDLEGWALAISGDGKFIAAGAPAGQRVVFYRKINNVWTFEASLSNGALGDIEGSSVAMNQEGTIVAVGMSAGNKVIIHEQVSSIEWIQTIILSSFPSPDIFGWAVALSKDGHRLAATDLYLAQTHIFDRLARGSWSCLLYTSPSPRD